VRIGIDIRSLIFTRAGISRYTGDIIKSLAGVDRDNEYSLFCNAKSRYSWSKYDNVKEEVIRFPHLGTFTEKLWEEILLPKALISKKIDLFHSTRFVLPKKKPCKFIVTIYDLAFKKFPSLIAKKAFKYFDREIKSAVNLADKIIVVSENTRKDLIDLFGAREDKIEVIYGGINENFRPIRREESLKKIRKKHRLPEKIILFVGSIGPRKNLKRLITAFYELKKNGSVRHKLVLVGEKGSLYEDISGMSKKLGLGHDVIFTGYIPESELPIIYNIADLLVYPSLYEGFGFPPLEAMACGIPIVASNVSSLPEVVGEAALLVDPFNVEAISGAMVRVLEDNDLRAKMIEKGFERLKKFSWEKTARKTLNLYRKCMAE